MEAHFQSNCSKNVAGVCEDPQCFERVKQAYPTGRWYITIDHAGFNTQANNRDGYASRQAALRASLRCLRAGSDQAISGRLALNSL